MESAREREHFLFLDGLRGIAAIAVVLLHWFEGFGDHAFGTSLLAVDFFFMLSGFVVAYAYRSRLRQGYSVGRFLMARAIRLYPLILAAIAVGALRYVGAASLEGRPPLDWQLVRQAVFTLLMIPSHVTGDLAMFPLNLALWSLHFEFLAYLAFGLVVYRWRDAWLVPPICVAAVGTAAWCITCFGPDADGTSFLPLEHLDYFYGLARITFSFFAGTFLFGLRERNRLQVTYSAPFAIFALIALFALPRNWLPPWVAMAALAGVFPLVISGGSRVNLSPRATTLARFLGDLSYPLYALHTPMLWMLSGVAKAEGFSLNGSLISNGVIIIPAVICLAYLAFRLWDAPARKFLKRRLLQHAGARSSFTESERFNPLRQQNELPESFH